MKYPLILLHGALGSAAQFEQLIPLMPSDWTVHTINFPGHGGTSLDQEFSIDRFSMTLLKYLDDHKIDRTKIFGYSMGGYTALHLAAKHPERIAGIITLGTKFHWTPEIAAREVGLLDADKIAAKVPAFAQLLAQRHAPADWREVLRKTAELLQKLGERPDLQAETLQSVRCPVLIGQGTEDHMVTELESRETAEQLPKGRFEALPGVKHPFEQVDPALVAQWLVQNLPLLNN